MWSSPWGIAALAVLAACSGSPGKASTADDPASARVELIQRQVDAWRDAPTLADAQAAAARARLLVTGPDIAGLEPPPDSPDDISRGLLPDEAGGAGLASPVADCAGPDLLGGSWDDAEQRWTILRTAIQEWAPGNNTFPSLPSHPQRVVGWASLTLRATSLEEAREYSGHAQLHVDAARDALADCG